MFLGLASFCCLRQSGRENEAVKRIANCPIYCEEDCCGARLTFTGRIPHDAHDFCVCFFLRVVLLVEGYLNRLFSPGRRRGPLSGCHWLVVAEEQTSCYPTRRRASPQTQSPLPLSKTTILLLNTQSFRSQCWAQTCRFNRINSCRASKEALSSSKDPNNRKFLFPLRVAKTSPFQVFFTSYRQNGGDTSATEMNGRLNAQRCGYVVSILHPVIFQTSHMSLRLRLVSLFSRVNDALSTMSSSTLCAG